MSGSLPFLPERDEVERRYRVETLADPQPAPGGLAHAGGEPIPWDSVAFVFAAEVGEPQGVRTVVFDLVLAGDGATFEVRRFDAEPGEEAIVAASELTHYVPSSRLSSAIKALAVDGLVVEWHADLSAFDEACLVALAEKRGQPHC